MLMDFRPFSGCKPRLLYMLIRHGTRYPGPDEIEAMQDHLPGLRAALLNQGPNSKFNLNVSIAFYYYLYLPLTTSNDMAWYCWYL